MNKLYRMITSNKYIVRLRPRYRLAYLRRFGLVGAVRIFRQISLTTGRTTVQLAGFRTPFNLRAHTSDAPIFEQVFILQEYDFPYPNLNPKLIIDAGANIGCASVYFAQRYPDARILSIEPEDQNFDLLIQNTSSYPNITPIRAALWNRKVQLGLKNLETENDGFQIREADSSISRQVESITIPELLDLGRNSYIDILKIDIEGSEYELFHSDYEDWLDKVNVVIIEVHELLHPGITAIVNNIMHAYAFKKSRIGENLVYIRYRQRNNESEAYSDGYRE